MDIADLQLADRGTWDDDQFGDLYSAVVAEYRRRVRIKSADQAGRQLIEDNAVEIGRTDGDKWVQPLAAFDAYLEGDVVQHDGKTWESLLDWNVWEPGVSGWREPIVEGEAPPEFVQPTGSHDAYNIGDQVTFEGAVYESVIDANTYSPTAYPAGWALVP